MRPRTTLQGLRLATFGTIADASRKLHLSRWTLRRAEGGIPVSEKTRQRFEEIFALSWAELQKPWRDLLEEKL
jgi:hypothetical protein